ncbi:MAG TPA: hypothetical protein VLK58_27415 [Conexibacter sp.]|nr:hypothetical protein [Conexibacter sp.]
MGRNEPWEQLLERGSRRIAEFVVAGIEQRVEELGLRGVEVFALKLVYVDQGSLHIEPVTLGLEADRGRWLVEEREEPDEYTDSLVLDLVYLGRDDEALNWINLPDWDEDLDALLLREAARASDADPYTTVLDEVARVLAVRDWEGLVKPTDAFVVYCAEHDEGIIEKLRAVRAANPPDRAARWQAMVEQAASKYPPFG